MLTVPTEIKDSLIANKGVFSILEIPKGKIVGLLPYQAKLISRRGYQKGQAEGDNLIIMTGVRWIGDYFIVGDEITNEEYINHSEKPNLLYHCGILIALRDIKPYEELTVNYQYFLAEIDYCRFIDNVSNKEVDGLTGIDSLKNSCVELLKLLSEIKEIT